MADEFEENPSPPMDGEVSGSECDKEFLEMLVKPSEEEGKQSDDDLVDREMEEQVTGPPAPVAAAAAAAADDEPPAKRSGCEAVGDKVDESISGFFYRLGHFCSFRPKTTIAISLGVAILCAMGMAKLTTENRPEKVSHLFVLPDMNIHIHTTRCGLVIFLNENYILLLINNDT